jgi:hypothetical protein
LVSTARPQPTGIRLRNPLTTKSPNSSVLEVWHLSQLAIHPNQMATSVRAYTPDEEAVANARRILATPQARAGDPTTIEGSMVDQPIYRDARRVVALADAHW